MTIRDKAYLAGFLDADGSIIIQLRHRSSFKYRFRVKITTVFYQDSRYHHLLKDFKTSIQAGYLYYRNDRMSKLRIEGFKQNKKLLSSLHPYARFKKPQIEIVLKAISILEKKYSLSEFLEVCKLSDEVSRLNYSSKRRIYTSQFVIQELKKLKIIPVTTGSPAMMGEKIEILAKKLANL